MTITEEPRVSAEEIKRNHPLEEYVRARGVDLKRNGHELVACCPFHEDFTPSFAVNPQKQVWTCRAGCGGGTVIDYAMKEHGLNFREACDKLAGNERPAAPLRPRTLAPPVSPVPARPPGRVVATYDYKAANGSLSYQVVRMEPKDFRQRRPDGNGGWAWGLNGTAALPYRLPELLAAPDGTHVWIVEGEKDADALWALGIPATCNSGGAGKWTDAHSRHLAGKMCIVCGDNDEPGQKHAEAVEKSLADHARSTRRVQVPDPHKDVSDYFAAVPNARGAMLDLLDLAEKAPELFGGIELPLRSIQELADSYRTFIRQASERAVDLSRWLPSLHGMIRPLVPGEMCTILAPTGAGKTAILQNIALALSPLYTAFFELELPETLTFERFISIARQRDGRTVWAKFRDQDDASLDWASDGRLDRIFTCDQSGLSIAQIKTFVKRAHLKMGHKPACVMVDYFSLLSAKGNSRYERMSSAAEEMKELAKSTDTVVIATSQVARKDAKETDEIHLSDAKDSGSIENSSGLLLGAWRDAMDPTLMHLRVLKSTKGGAGRTLKLRIAPTLQIQEAALALSAPN